MDVIYQSLSGTIIRLKHKYLSNCTLVYDEDSTNGQRMYVEYTFTKNVPGVIQFRENVALRTPLFDEQYG
jgi:hypothetical protein